MFHFNNQLGWVGFGIVRDMQRLADRCLCRITPIYQGKTQKDRLDEVWLNCDIYEPRLLQWFYQVEAELYLGHPIFLQFAATYLGFESAQFDQDKDYQNHLLNFHAKLVDVEAWFVRGKKHTLR